MRLTIIPLRKLTDVSRKRLKQHFTFQSNCSRIIYNRNDETSSNIRQVVICVPAIKFMIGKKKCKSEFRGGLFLESMIQRFMIYVIQHFRRIVGKFVFKGTAHLYYSLSGLHVSEHLDVVGDLREGGCVVVSINN